MRMLVFALVLVTRLCAQNSSPAAVQPFTDSSLGFQYTPPSGMHDTTSDDQQTIRERAAELHSSNTMTLLLSQRAGSSDTAGDWRAISIETYPRQKMNAASDHDASVVFARWVARLGTETGEPSDQRVGDFRFVISTFELTEGPLTKRARVYTTVRQDRMLAIAFTANSPDVLKRIAESMDTFAPYPQPSAPSAPLPASVKSAKTVFLQDETGDRSVPWSAQQVLRTSKLRVVARRTDADLVFHFTPITHLPSPTTVTIGAKLPFTNTLNLEVLDRTGVSVWEQSAEWKDAYKPAPSPDPMGTSEKARADFLRTHPPADLVDRFLKQISR
ncbi:MAG: hypothetical protein WA628_25750 [Terriglobales bacterium]